MATRLRHRGLGLAMAMTFTILACGGTGGSTTPSASTPGGSASAVSGQLPAPEITTIRIGVSAATEPVQFAEKLADYLGLYKKYGFSSVTVTGFEGDGKALQATIAGQLDLFVGGASTTVSSVITDTPLKVVAMNSVTLTENLYCQKDIKTAADLKGKSIAISTFGGTSHGEVLLDLQGLGLTTKDVVIKEVGNQGTRIAALTGGSIACAVIGVDLDADMKARGFNLVYDLSRSKQQWGRSGLMATSDFLKKNPNTVLDVVAATLEAQNSIWTDTKTAIDQFAQYAQAKPADAATAVNAFLSYGDRSMMFTEDAFKAPRDVLATVNPAVANVDVTKAFDLSFLQKLKDMGFYQKNGIPLS